MFIHKDEHVKVEQGQYLANLAEQALSIKDLYLIIIIINYLYRAVSIKKIVNCTLH